MERAKISIELAKAEDLEGRQREGEITPKLPEKESLQSRILGRLQTKLQPYIS